MKPNSTNFLQISAANTNLSTDQTFLLSSQDLLIKKVSRFAGNEKYEAWIYCVGALKLLSGNSVLRKTMVNSGCIEALGIVLRNIIKQVR